MPSRPWLRWLVPLAAILVIAASALVADRASADETLPPRSAEQLLVDLQEAEVDGFSGTVEQTADLGIPALPGVSEHGSDFSSLVSGTHTLRVAHAAPDKSKVALLGDLSESSVIRNGDDVWTWSSKANEATHATIERDEADSHADQPKELPSDAPKTPQEAAQRLLAAVDDSTEVTVATDTKVAGRAAYELVLRPEDSRSLIRSVRVAVDAAERVALRVQVFAGDRPAPVASISFTEVDFATPPASAFEFTPPQGAKVTEIEPDADSDPRTDADREAPEPTIIGDGWTRVVVGTVPEDAMTTSGPADRDRPGDEIDVQAYLAQLPSVSGSWGSGRLLAGTAFSVVITDDGRVAGGAVPPELLYAALG